MGKSLTAAMLRKMGCAVHSADAAVHRLLNGAAAAAVGQLFPAAIKDGIIDRAALGAEIFADPDKRRQLEAILHPLVREEEKLKAARARAAGRKALVLDIPLLFETGAEKRCDAVICVSAPAWLQRRRVLARPGMTPEKLAQILAAQLPDAEKRRRADYVVNSGFGRCAAWLQLRYIMAAINARPRQ